MWKIEMRLKWYLGNPSHFEFPFEHKSDVTFWLSCARALLQQNHAKLANLSFDNIAGSCCVCFYKKISIYSCHTITSTAIRTFIKQTSNCSPSQASPRFLSETSKNHPRWTRQSSPLVSWRVSSQRFAAPESAWSPSTSLAYWRRLWSAHNAETASNPARRRGHPQKRLKQPAALCSCVYIGPWLLIVNTRYVWIVTIFLKKRPIIVVVFVGVDTNKTERWKVVKTYTKK